MAINKPVNATANELMTEDMSFLEDFAGQGLESIEAKDTAIAYLSLVQPDSTSEDEDNPAGTWRNSANGRNYGNDVRVVVLAFRTVWSEREADPPFNTVGRYDVGGIQIEMKLPPKGKRGYPKMINPETGNEVQELYMYALMLPDYPEDGVLYFNPTVGGMRTCKSWNSQLKGQLLKNGAQAPIFGFAWLLNAGLVPNPQQPSKEVAKFIKASRDVMVSKDLFEDHIKPQLTAVQQSVAQITAGIAEDEE